MDFDRLLPMKWRVTAVYLAVGAIWGSAWIPNQTLSQSLPELEVGVLRFGLAAIVLGVVVTLRHFGTSTKGKAGAGPGAGPDARPDARPDAGRSTQGQAAPARSALGLLFPSALLGVTMLALPYALTVWAAEQLSAGVVALCFATMPLFLLFFAGAENTGPGNTGPDRGDQGSAIPAVALGIGGVAMVVAPGLSVSLLQARGAAALLLAVALEGFSMIYTRRLYASGRLKSGEIPAFSAIQFASASVFLAVLTVSTGQHFTFRLDETAALRLATIAIVISAGTLPLFYWLLQSMAAWQLGTLQWVATLVAVGEAALMIRVRPSLEGWIGAVLVPACIAWILSRTQNETSGRVTPQITIDTFSGLAASDKDRDSR
ncbi:drug/metabolite transporter (DMT)-like permease [Silvibacterium bohemicum]|uniref:Drug/metabolite transporter (DMT)-like permease n=1 Tax=Silvibacterium bohemicum TaxID=1577686 RepID=A0A841JVJ2_9BACT|nr:DMT family transporter [Silvibacterium bohemicum]MBB6145403.1 drug/metabolite transporter (DMT)-like permease [Silvibacterium bohemicum]